MNSRELVSKTIQGENNTGITPIYGWVRANLEEPITDAFGSVASFEDHYEFDMAHLFGGPYPHRRDKFKELRENKIEITPEVILDIPKNPLDNMEDYQDIIKELEHHQEKRGRFCYVQTPGIFECINGILGIEKHLLYMALYPEKMEEVYQKQADWNRKFADHMIDLGVDMIHISDDWGAQEDLLFSRDMWDKFIYPNHKIVCDRVKERDCFLSLHSDGNVSSVVDGILDLGYDVVHPWQESAGMSYDLYLDEYQNDFAILGGLCVQTTIGFGKYDCLEREIRRVFDLLQNKRWLFCTTHFIQDHCSIDELTFAYDLILELAKR